MKTRKYGKLVRDNIPEIIEKNCEIPVFHISGQKDISMYLRNKLLEEVDEFFADFGIEEMADIFEVIDAIIKECGFNKNEILEIQKSKVQKNGGFEKRIILDEVINNQD